MFLGTIATNSNVLFVMGLYLGQVMFRYSGAGRLDADSYSTNARLVLKLIFGLILVLLYEIPNRVESLFNSSDISLWANAIFVIAIPYLMVGFMISYSLPKLTSRACKYPQTLPEVTDSDNTHDPEKGTGVKCLQIKGKSSDILFVQNLTLAIFSYRIPVIKIKNQLHRVHGLRLTLLKPCVGTVDLSQPTPLIICSNHLRPGCLGVEHLRLFIRQLVPPDPFKSNHRQLDKIYSLKFDDP